ncbi:MAG: GDP-L-fucose synthase, partial [Bacillota bacterium]
GYDGEVVLDRTKPDGTPRKLLSVNRISAMGWVPSYNLQQGIEETYRWFLESKIYSK